MLKRNSTETISDTIPTSQRAEAGWRSSFTATRRLAVGFVAAGLLFSACGSSSDAGGSTDATTEASDSGDSAGPAVIKTASSDLGDILVGSTGITVYGFTNDAPGVSNCEGDCAVNWPPLMSSSAELPAGLDASVFSVIERTDGGFQIQAGDWPLYFFAGDSAAGDTNGQGVGDVWFVVDPTGELIK